MKNLIILCGGDITDNKGDIVPLKQMDVNRTTLLRSIITYFLNRESNITKCYVVLTKKTYHKSIDDECLAIQNDITTKIETILLPFNTSGPAETTYQLIKRRGIDGQIIIKDCDVSIELGDTNLDGNFIGGMDISDNSKIIKNKTKFSNLILDKNEVFDIIENGLRTNYVSTGLYGFSNASDYCYAYDFLVNSFYRYNQPLYMSHIISFLIGIRRCSFKFVPTLNCVDYRNDYKKRLAIFDLDGTLVDTFETNYLSYKEALSQLGYNLKRSDYKKWYGYNYRVFLSKLFGIEDSKRLGVIHNLKLSLYKQHLKESILNTQLIDLIKSISSDYNIVCCTTASRTNADLLLQYFDIKNLFNLIIYQEDVKHLKPNLECYEMAMKTFNCSPNQTIIFEDGKIGLLVKKKFKGKTFVL